MAAFQQLLLPIYGANNYEIENEFGENGYDSDVIDTEFEASLYAKIFHRDLLWYQNTEDLSQSTSDHQDETVEHKRTNMNVTDSAISSDRIEIKLVSRVKRSMFVGDFDSDEEERMEGDGYQREEELPDSLAITSNIAGLEESVKRRKRLETRRDRNRRRFLRTPQSEWAAKFTIAEIQQFLGGTPDDWRISHEDTGRSIFGDRYYGKKGQGMECRRCREHGHLARECRTKMPRYCPLCGGPHNERRCKERFECILCFQFGHTSEACGKVNSMRPITVACSRCHQSGHRVHACPEYWRQFHSTTSWDAAFPLKRDGLLSNAEKRTRATYCYNCGRGGHLGHECRRPTVFGGRLTCFKPVVSVYDTAYLPPDEFPCSKTSKSNGFWLPMSKSSSTSVFTKGSWQNDNGDWRKYASSTTEGGYYPYVDTPSYDQPYRKKGYRMNNRSKYPRFDSDTSPAGAPGPSRRNGRSNFDRLLNQIHSSPSEKGIDHGRQKNKGKRKSGTTSKEDQPSNGLPQECVTITGQSCQPVNGDQAPQDGIVMQKPDQTVGERVKINSRPLRETARSVIRAKTKRHQNAANQKNDMPRKKRKIVVDFDQPTNTIATRVKERTRAARYTPNGQSGHSDAVRENSVEKNDGFKCSAKEDEFEKPSVEAAAGTSSLSRALNVNDFGNPFSWDQTGNGNGQSRRSAWF